MPIYEFECSCGCSFDRLCSLGLEESACPSCGGVAGRIISVPAPPVIKGEGGNWNRFVEKNRFPWKPEKSLARPGDLGSGIKMYDIPDLDKKKLAQKADLFGE